MPKIFGTHTPAELKNLAINGGFDFWQRFEANTQTINTSASQNAYTADMWSYFSGGTSTHNYSIAQGTNTLLTETQSGFQSNFVYVFTRITGLPSFATSDYTSPAVYRMEGFDYAKIHGKLVTFGFWMQATAAGTYSFVLQNGTQTRAYGTTFTISGSNTWQYVTVSIQMEVPTTNYVFTSGLGLQVIIGAVTGTTFAVPSANSWLAGQFFASPGVTNWMATSAANIQIAQFSIVEGPLGLGATGFARAGLSIQQELALCQRYYQKSLRQGLPAATGQGVAGTGLEVLRWDATSNNSLNIKFPVVMRVSPSITTYNPVSANSNFRDFDNGADRSFIGSFAGPGTVALYGQNFVLGQTGIHWSADAGL